MAVTVKTNNQWRDLVYRQDVPADILASDFDYQDAETILDGFFCYRGRWYHTDQFMRVDYHNGQNPFADGHWDGYSGDNFYGHWDGYSGDSFFSGVLIKLSNDGERVICGTYYS